MQVEAIMAQKSSPKVGGDLNLSRLLLYSFYMLLCLTVLGKRKVIISQVLYCCRRELLFYFLRRIMPGERGLHCGSFSSWTACMMFETNRTKSRWRWWVGVVSGGEDSTAIMLFRHFLSFHSVRNLRNGYYFEFYCLRDGKEEVEILKLICPHFNDTL